MLRALMGMERTFYAARQKDAPLLREREVFLEHLLQQGTSLAAARGVSWQLLNVIRLLKLTRLRDVWIEEIEEAAQQWTREQRSNPNVRSYKSSGAYFIYVAKKWLRFAGVLKTPAIPRIRFADEIDEFARWVTEEKGCRRRRRGRTGTRYRSFSSGFPNGSIRSLPYGSRMWTTS